MRPQKSVGTAVFLEFLFPGLGFFYIGDNYAGGWVLITSVIAAIAIPIAFAVYLGQNTPGDSQTTVVTSTLLLGSFVLALTWLIARCFWVARAIEAINNGQGAVRQFSWSLTALSSQFSGFGAAQYFASPQQIASKRLVGLDVDQVSIPDNFQKQLGIAQRRACLVTHVLPSSPAERCDLRAKDIIVAWNGVQIKNYLDLQREMATMKRTTAPGTATVALKIIRLSEGQPSALRSLIFGQPELLDLTLTF